MSIGNRVVITGCGAVSPFGIGKASLFDSVWKGRSGIKKISEWSKVKGLNSLLAAPVPAFDPKQFLPRNNRRSMGPMAVYAAIAAKEAVGDANLDTDDLGSGTIGVAIGSTTGSPSIYEELFKEYFPDESIESIKSGLFFKIMGHSCAANVCQVLNIKGEQWSPASACTSSSQALGLGYLLIKAGRQKAMICGGADEVHHTVTMIFDVVRAASHMNDTPELTPRPFDRDRDGVVCGAGSGILVLESLDSAISRGAKIYAEILGFGHVNDNEHIANPQTESMARAMANALQEAAVSPSEIDYVNAHATGTIIGDVAEAKAISKAISADVPVSSFKGHLGHTLGAAGSLETLVLLEMMQRQEVVPTLNLANPDPACGCNLVREISAQPINLVLKNNFALGGVNTALVLKRWEK
jgi:3-oxoacyl-[acyl-carrier-protein] synthase II